MSKILIDRSVVEQALDALKDNIEYDFNGNPYEEGDELMQVTASKLSAALEQPLMEEEICKLMVSGDYLTVKGLTKFVRDIELAHGIKEQK